MPTDTFATGSEKLHWEFVSTLNTQYSGTSRSGRRRHPLGTSGGEIEELHAPIGVDSSPSVKPEPEPKPLVKPDPDAKPEPEPKPLVKPDPGAEPKPEPKPSSNPDPNDQPEPEAEPEVQAPTESRRRKMIRKFVSGIPKDVIAKYLLLLLVATAYTYTFDVLVKYVPNEFLNGTWAMLIMHVPRYFHSPSKRVQLYFGILSIFCTYMLNRSADAYIRNLDTQQGNAVLFNKFFEALQRNSDDPEMTPFNAGVALHKVTYACTYKNEFRHDQCAEELKNGMRISNSFFRALSDVTQVNMLFKEDFSALSNKRLFNLSSLKAAKAVTDNNVLEVRNELAVLGVSRLIMGQKYEQNISSFGRAAHTMETITEYLYEQTTYIQLAHVFMGGDSMIGRIAAARSLFDVLRKNFNMCMFGQCLKHGLYYLDIVVPQKITVENHCFHDFCYVGLTPEEKNSTADTNSANAEERRGPFVKIETVCDLTLDNCVHAFPNECQHSSPSIIDSAKEIAYNLGSAAGYVMVGYNQYKYM